MKNGGKPTGDQARHQAASVLHAPAGAAPLDLRQLVVTQDIAAHALKYLLDHTDGREAIVHEGPHVTWFLGWGGRALYRRGKKYQLKSFRRFEYRYLQGLVGVPLDYNEQVLRFKALMKGDGNE